MATFKAEVYKHQKRADGTWNVKIRVTHNRQKKYLSTPIYVKQDDISRSSFKLKKNITDKTDKIIEEYEEICANLGPGIKTMSLDQLVAKLYEGIKPKYIELDFVKFAREFIQEKIDSGHKNTFRNYSCALNALIRFARRDTIMISEITSTFIAGYIKFLQKEKEARNLAAIKKKERVTTHRAVYMYPVLLKAIHNAAKDKYNDEDAGIVLIPWSPFKKLEFPQIVATRKRAIEIEMIRKIIDLPYRKTITGKIRTTSSYNLAKDMFVLSFGLMGMNSVDLYNCKRIEGRLIIYNRAKTMNQRIDQAEMQVLLQPHIEYLYEKYKDLIGERVFRFYQMFKNERVFNYAINRGLKMIGEELGIEDFEFYAARHSWATIALNDLNINKYTVHEALNHVDPSMKITEIYIKRDFTEVNRANKKVLDNLFGVQEK